MSCDYFMSQDQSTNQPIVGEVPTVAFSETYLSVRITLPHSQIEEKVLPIFDGSDFAVFRHKGARSFKEHVHVFVVSDNKRDSEKFRNRLKKSFTGNKEFSLKFMSNGLLKGLQYGSKEGTTAICTSGLMEDAVRAAPPWEPQESRLEDYFSTKEAANPEKERDWQLIYSNLVCQAVRYAKGTHNTSLSLKMCVKDMIQKTKWRPTKQVIAGGVPPFYEQDYEVRLGKRKEIEMDWWNNYSVGR